MLVGQIGQPLADRRDPSTNGFWLSTCLPRLERGFDQRRPHGGVRGDVDDFDIVAAQAPCCESSVTSASG